MNEMGSYQSPQMGSPDGPQYPTPPPQGHPHQPDPYLQQPGPWQQPSPPAAKSPIPWILGGVGAVLLVCLTVVAVVAMNTDDDSGDTAAAAAASSTAEEEEENAEENAEGGDEPTSDTTVTVPEDLCDQISLSAFGELGTELELQSSLVGDLDLDTDVLPDSSGLSCSYVGDPYATDVLYRLEIYADSYADTSTAEERVTTSREHDEDFYPDATITDITDLDDGGYLRVECGTDQEDAELAATVRSGTLVLDVVTEGYGTFDASELSDMVLAEAESVLALL